MRWLLLASLLACALWPACADDAQLSAEHLAVLDRGGYFTPAFKAAVHDLVSARQDLAHAKSETKTLTLQLPGLQKKAGEHEAVVASLQQELAAYEHPEETDFTELQAKMSDPNAKLEEVIAMAQAYVWAYPTSPHQSEAARDLAEVQKKLADRIQAAKDAEAARVAARAALVQRAQNKQLSLIEWRDFLRDMSQEDLLKYLGRPDQQTSEYWVYAGDWTTDPVSSEKVGMEIYFNAGRVLSVAEIHH